MSLANELSDLEDLRARGTLTNEEFEQAKAQLLTGGKSGVGQICGMDENIWCTLMHLSQLLTFSMAGIVVPIVMWILSKDESEIARRHGAAMMNWLFSSIIYLLISLILVLAVIGIPMLFVLGIMHLAFPVMAAIKAYEGKTWSYPLTIRFFPEY